MLSLILAAVVFAQTPQPPPPDPYPGSTAPVTICCGIDYTLPAVNANTGKTVRGMHFKCHMTRTGVETCRLVFDVKLPGRRRP